jgi:hypothetical protein
MSDIKISEFPTVAGALTGNEFIPVLQGGVNKKAALSQVPFPAGPISSTSTVTAYSATPIPAGGTTGAGITVSSTANFGVFFGSGVPTLSAGKGSLYLRSDGSGVNDRMYVNTDNGATWAAVVTAS